MNASTIVFETRLAVADILGAADPQRVIFTPGCTQSINMVLLNFPFQAKDLVLVSSLEHNAIMRPLKFLEQAKGIEIVQVPYSEGHVLDLLTLERMLSERTPRLCCFMEASNVTGEILDLPELTRLLSSAKIPLLIDAAQSAGSFHARLDSLHGDYYWAASAHKGLMGSPGLGILYFSENLGLPSFVHGGTGSKSEDLYMPAAYPDRLEAGTMPGPAIAALKAGVEFLQASGREKIREHELKLSAHFISSLANDKRFKVFASESKPRTSVVSFRVQGLDSSLVAEKLDREYEICVRSGLHCAASAHRTLGTLEGGLVRASFGYFNRLDEVEKLLEALGNIACMADG